MPSRAPSVCRSAIECCHVITSAASRVEHHLRKMLELSFMLTTLRRGHVVGPTWSKIFGPFVRAAISVRVCVSMTPNNCDKTPVCMSYGVPLPRRGHASKPRVAASATLGKKAIHNLQPHRGCDRVKSCCTDATALRLRNSLFSSQGSRSGNPGLWAAAPSGQDQVK